MNYSKKIALTRWRSIRPVDVKSEQLTFGQRIGLGQCLQQPLTDFELMQKVMATMHNGLEVRVKDIARLADYFTGILNGLVFWMEKEKQLQYEPTPEERQAGINEISKKVGEFSTVDAIATRMCILHDDALKLPYSTVFAMLLKDLETSKFERRLHKVYERKHHAKR